MTTNVASRVKCLFVYGTLRRGSKIKIASQLHANSEFLGQGRMNGRLTRSHPHRGAIQSDRPGEWIAGELFQLNDPSKLLPILDEYEGSEYKRISVPVELESGKRLKAWMYLLKD
jgi:gamma-glutamylcyclotransferase (GGCT)/AIG2-like uncharacterized protein YtfP